MYGTPPFEFQALDLEQLVGGLVLADAVHHEAALGVKDQAEVLVRLLQLDDVHETSGVGCVGADLAVHLDQALLEDLHHLLVCKGIPVQSVCRKSLSIHRPVCV